MSNNLWKKLAVLSPLFGGVLIYIAIPLCLSNYNETKSLREARLATAVKFGDYNTDFNSKANGLATLMGFFASHNQRMKNADLKDAKFEFFKNYKDRYLADINSTVWWWPNELIREVALRDLLSPEDIKRLQALVDKYNESLLATVNALHDLRVFMDTLDYKASDKSQKTIDAMKAAMNTEMGNQSTIRYNLTGEISALFVKSNYKTTWRSYMGLP